MMIVYLHLVMGAVREMPADLFSRSSQRGFVIRFTIVNVATEEKEQYCSADEGKGLRQDLVSEFFIFPPLLRRSAFIESSIVA